MKIPKSICLMIVLCFLTGCTSKQEKVERIIEDGVEVILNRIEPYAVTGAHAFTLEKILTIDTENDQMAEMGPADISSVDVDSKGNIFLANWRAKNSFIFIFDQAGLFVSAFGNRGEGPGEFQNPIHMAVSDQDEIFVTDRGKVVMFSNSGDFIKEFRIDREYQQIIPLNKEKYLVIAVKMNEDLSQSFQVLLCSSDMKELKVLDSSEIGSFAGMEKVNIIPTLLYWAKSGEFIFTGNTDEYELRVFDFNGNPVRRIKKEFDVAFLTEGDEERYQQRLSKYPPNIKDNFFIPEAYPPFQNIVAFRDNRLFVQTYEVSNDGASIFDIFNSEGVFISRAELEGIPQKFRGDRVYCLKEKSSGYMELIVYRMIWQ